MTLSGPPASIGCISRLSARAARTHAHTGGNYSAASPIWLWYVSCHVCFLRKSTLRPPASISCASDMHDESRWITSLISIQFTVMHDGCINIHFISVISGPGGPLLIIGEIVGPDTIGSIPTNRTTMGIVITTSQSWWAVGDPHTCCSP